MKEDAILLPSLAEWASEVRLVGNIGAHYDPLEIVSKKDSSDLLGFTRELIKYLYEIPANLERRRQESGDS